MSLPPNFHMPYTLTHITDGGSQESEKVEDSNKSEAEMAILVHLKEVIQVVYSCLDQYQGMQSTEIKNAATELMTAVKS